MEATLTPVAEAFHDVPAARPLPCGVTAHLVDPSHIGPGPAHRHARHDRITRARHTGWYADEGEFEILTGFVYAFADDAGDGDDDPPTSYYALVESDDTDCHYLDPDVYDDPVAAAHAADRMAELIAQLERECDRIRNRATQARSELAEANRTRRDALGILRHVRACPVDATRSGPRSAPLRSPGRDAAGFRPIDEHRRRRANALRPGPHPRPQCLADAVAHGWDCAI